MTHLDDDAREIARCETCGAAWLDARAIEAAGRGSLDDTARAFIVGPPSRPRSVAQPVFRGVTASKPTERCCPRCDRALAPVRVEDANTQIDVCREHGTFFPPGAARACLVAADIERVLAEEAKRPVEAVVHTEGKSLAWIAWVAFAVSCALPAVDISIFSKSSVPGFFALLFSPLVLGKAPYLLPTVLANLIAIAMPAWCSSGRTMTTVVAIVLGLGALGAFGFYGVAGGRDLEVGYWLWAASLALGALAFAYRRASWPIASRH